MLPLDFLDQHLTEFGIGNRARTFDQKIRLAGNHFEARFAASVAIRVGETFDRRARHQKRFQNPFVHHADFVPGRAHVEGAARFAPRDVHQVNELTAMATGTAIIASDTGR